MRRWNHRWILTWMCAVLLAVASACVSKKTAAAASPANPALPEAYLQAVTMAQNPTPEKIFDSLVPVVPGNTHLTWKDIGGQSYVLVVTYTTSFKYYQDYLGKPYNTGSYNIWVTASPFVQELCQDPAWAGGDLSLRLNQLLGLPPGTGHVGFVEIWVRPQDLFRPCPDNEITDEVCGLALPAATEAWYRSWFNDLRAGQYYFCPPSKLGYPWTQLGYTFDWNDLGSPVGMSEFVIKENVEVIIEALSPTDQYCAPP